MSSQVASETMSEVFNENEIGQLIETTLRESKSCVFLKAAALEWKSTNSTVLSLPSFRLLPIIRKWNECLVASSLVSISGPTDESLHFHKSHVIGIATYGIGILRHKRAKSEIEQRTTVEKGDIAIIPRNVLHLFETNPSDKLEYIAFEISSEKIDYQKHWTEEFLSV